MIESISITNLGVIESTELAFGQGLTVLTGETGAGKTMVLTSLHLLLGRRADPGIVRKGAAQAHVDGIFLIPEALIGSVEETGAQLDEDELIVSRSVPAQGRSRARIGGRPVPAGILAELTESLVTIHGQADQLQLKGVHAQRETLDAYGGPTHTRLVSDYAAAWSDAVQAKKALDESLSSQEERQYEIENLRRAIEAIHALDVHPGEEDELRAETERLTNVEDLRALLSRAHHMLHADGEGAVELTRQALEEIRHAGRFDREMESYEARLNSLRLELEAMAEDLGAYARTLEADPERLAALHERRAALRDVMRGRAADTSELLEWYEAARERLDHLTQVSASPEERQSILEAAQQRVLHIGSQLSEARRNVAEQLCAAVTHELHGLAMPNARFFIEMPERKPSPHGLEDVLFLLQPHPDMNPAPLGQGASGGELSRVMLALEVTMGARSGSPTYIFDEVDAGIGGRTATEVGRRLAQLAQHKQVIVVTHLPQVAAWASQHLVVTKEGATTTVRAVHGEERIEEIARMMGADEGSDVARRHAKELINAVNMQQSKA